MSISAASVCFSSRICSRMLKSGRIELKTVANDSPGWGGVKIIVKKSKTGVFAKEACYHCTMSPNGGVLSLLPHFDRSVLPPYEWTHQELNLPYQSLLPWARSNKNKKKPCSTTISTTTWKNAGPIFSSNLFCGVKSLLVRISVRLLYFNRSLTVHYFHVIKVPLLLSQHAQSVSQSILLFPKSKNHTTTDLSPATLAYNTVNCIQI